jgi:methionyl-tRNA formyltransferase
LRTVFLGTSRFAAAVLERLASGPHRPVLVLTRPDRPSGRGRRLATPPVAEVARTLGIAVEQPERVNDPETRELIEQTGGQAADSARQALSRPHPSSPVLVVCAFGALIKEPLLSAYPMLNVHPSLLPRWRGAAPIERAIMAGDERTGVSIMRVTAGLDSGPVALSDDIAIGPEDDFESLAGRLERLGAELIVEGLERLGAGDLRFIEQDEDGATYAQKIDPSERRLDPARPAAELGRTVRALTPHIGAYLETADGTRLGVRRARPIDAAVARGTILAESGALLLGCGQGTLRLDVVQPAGGRPMAADAFLRGHELPKL